MAYPEQKTPTVEAVITPLSELSPDALQIGDIVSDIDGSQGFDAFEEAIETHVYGNSSTERRNQGRAEKVAYRLGDEMAPKGFHGKLKNGQALVVPVRTTYRTTGLSFLLNAELHSTGRGKVGTVQRLVIYDGSTRKLRKFSNPAQAEGYVKTLHWEAGAIEWLLTAAGVETPTTAGLPTLGKR